MEIDKLDIRVGDRVTYKIKFSDRFDEEIRTELITGSTDLKILKSKEKNIEIITIERTKYEVVEEKKELLTEEEKAFLKQICKYYNYISLIYFSSDDTILFFDEDFSAICKFNFYPKNMEFKKIERDKKYTLKELGLEEI